MRCVRVARTAVFGLIAVTTFAFAGDEPASKPNPPDNHLATLEDLYGDTGNQFRAAVEFFTREATPATPSGFTGFGVAVDDMVISWKETRLDEDSHTHCASGGVCATLESAASVSYEGNAVVALTVTDATPYSVANPVNDCNGDGDYTDAANHCWNLATNSGSDASCPTVGAACRGIPGSLPGEYCYAPDSQDCNANGKLDVTVKLTTDAPGETTGEIAVLDQVSPGSPVYRANAPYSTFYDSPGTLFVVQSGTQPPVIRAVYFDRNDGTGAPCKNSLDPGSQGKLEADTPVSVTSGRITVNSYSTNLVSTCSLNPAKQCAANTDCGVGEGTCFVCSLLPAKPCVSQATCTAGQGVCTSTAGKGDQDGFADTNETINLAVQFANKSGVDVDDLTATLGTTSPYIECVNRSVISVGALANGALSNTANYPAFQFKVANVNRTSLTQVMQATFTVTMRSNKFDALTRASAITIDLDLNATGNPTTAAFVEDFEVSGFDKFTQDTLDAGKNSILASAGYRCQYNDPFGLNSNDPWPSNTDCFLGFATDPTSGVNDWHIHTSTHGGMGRAFTGKQSLHYGVHKSASSPSLDVYRFKQLDAIKTTNPVFLPLAGSNPELNFAQQIALIDGTSGVGVTFGEAPDRGVVEVQTASNGVPQGNWIKIYPYVNLYDEQGTDDFSNCLFDPIDDGNDEKSFFDPTDPLRSHGPSSTCFPEFCFVRQGQTDYRKTFDVSDIGNASDGPGLQGCSGTGCLPANTLTTIHNPGTWVRPRFSLNLFAGRAIRFRFLITTVDLGVTQTTDLFFGRGDIPNDDGWYIDDVHIDQALSAALTLSIDTATITPIPCGSCSSLTPVMTATPPSPSVPGQIVTLEAKNSSVASCLNGVIQYQFWIDANANGIVGDAGDTLLRDWTDNSTLIDAPSQAGTTRYGLKIRCSTNASCGGTDAMVLPVVVPCPSSASLSLASIHVDKPSLTGAEPDVNAVIGGWGGNLAVKVIRGDLALLRSSGGIANVDTSGCLANGSFVASVADNTAPASGAAYYLVRSATACNVVASGSYGQSTDASEKPGAGGNRDADIAADPDACVP